MPLSAYVQYAEAIAQELCEAVTASQVDRLREELWAMAAPALQRRYAETRELAQKLLREAPARRARRPEWADPLQRPWLALITYWHARLAAEVLAAANAVQPGASYRETAAVAAELGFGLMNHNPVVWPWAEPAPSDSWEIG